MVAHEVERGHLVGGAQDRDRLVLQALLDLAGSELAAQSDHVAIAHDLGQLAHRAGLEDRPWSMIAIRSQSFSASSRWWW